MQEEQGGTHLYTFYGSLFFVHHNRIDIPAKNNRHCGFVFALSGLA